eukprot:12208967-Karenia_brevis.AAC.1
MEKRHKGPEEIFSIMDSNVNNLYSQVQALQSGYDRSSNRLDEFEIRIFNAEVFADAPVMGREQQQRSKD